MTDKKPVSSLMELYPPLNHPFKDVKVVSPESYELVLPEHLWSAPDENGVQQKTIRYQADGMSKEARQRLHNEAHGTFEDDAEFVEFSSMGTPSYGYLYHETGHSPNPIDDPQLVHHSDALMYAQTYSRLRKLGHLGNNAEGEYLLEFSFRIARYMSHGIYYSRYATNRDGQLTFHTIQENGVI